MHLTIQESNNLLESQSFATHALYVTRQKDTEPNCAHSNNAYDPGNPIVKFSDFFDGEFIRPAGDTAASRRTRRRQS